MRIAVLFAGLCAAGCAERALDLPESPETAGATPELGDANLRLDAAPMPDLPDALPDLTSPDLTEPPQLLDGGQCCGDEQNTSFPPETNCGGTTIAWQYVPSCSFAVTRIEIHTTGGTVALLDSDGAKPGATLFSGTLSPSSAPGWMGAQVSPPRALTGGHVYWIQESPGQCSIATDGIQYPYYGMLTGTWEGPYMHWAWTSHVIGSCR